MRKNWLSPQRILAIFIIANLILGIFIARDFGVSTDENAESKRVEIALLLYSGKLETNPETAYSDLNQIQYYGTASSSIAYGLDNALQSLLGTQPSTVRHYLYFVFFQIGVVAIYFLAVKFVDEWIALITAVAFGTQPLLFGHAFMNPKDIPLMSVFLAAVTAGFYMVDHLASLDPPSQTKPDKINTRKQRQLIILMLAVWGLQFIKNFLFQPLAWLVTTMYNAPENSVPQKLFQLIAAGGSLDGYLVLAERALYNAYVWFAVLLLAALIFFAYQAQRNKLFPGWVNLPVLMAGAIWGFAISTRVIALAAGGIVGIYGLIKLWKRGTRYLVSYTLTAGTVSYLSWPYLWTFGFKGLFNSLLKFSDFYWEKEILFEGQLYPIDAIPARYLPKLMLIQFTEPVVILALAGFLLSVYLLVKKKLDWAKISLLYAWFALPLLYTILADTVTYNNFRQYLFITPPLFILAAITVQAAMDRLKKKIFFALAAAAILLPGIFSLIQLHPYQYVYYNQFVGGVAGAYHQYELDYWLLSYKEMAKYIDENIAPGSRILVWVNDNRIKIYTENDYKFVNEAKIAEEDHLKYEFAVMPVIRLYDQTYLTDQVNVYEIVRDDAVIGLVKIID